MIPQSKVKGKKAKGKSEAKERAATALYLCSLSVEALRRLIYFCLLPFVLPP
jgi:hypothetical protein